MCRRLGAFLTDPSPSLLLPHRYHQGWGDRPEKMKQREGDRGDKGEEMRGRRREGEGERWGGGRGIDQ